VKRFKSIFDISQPITKTDWEVIPFQMLSPTKNVDRKRAKPSRKDTDSEVKEEAFSGSLTCTPSKLLSSPISSLKQLLWTPNKENVDVDSNATPLKKKPRTSSHDITTSNTNNNNNNNKDAPSNEANNYLAPSSTSAATSHFITSSPQRPVKQPLKVPTKRRNLNADFATVDDSTEQNNVQSSKQKDNTHKTIAKLSSNEVSGTSTDDECSSSQEDGGRHPLKKKNSLLNALFSPVFHTLFGQNKHNGSPPHNHGKCVVDHSEDSSSEHESPIGVPYSDLISDETLNELSAYILPVVAPTCTDISDLYPPHEGTEDDVEVEEREDSDEERIIEEEFDPFLFISTLPPPTKEQLSRPPMIPAKSPDCTKKTLVLDLDETLVHCSVEPISSPELIFPVLFNNVKYEVYVRKRPHFLDFLKRVSKMFEVVVFTASQEVYASKLLDLLDPNKEFIQHRLYRDACVCIEGNYLKDLNILGRDLKHTVIVDNSPQAFGFQLDNGIPIESWFEDQSDKELLKLLPLLENLVHADDVRPLVREHFKLHERVSVFQTTEEETVTCTSTTTTSPDSDNNCTVSTTTTTTTTTTSSIKRINVTTRVK